MFSFSSRVLSSWLVKSVSWVRRIQSVSQLQTDSTVGMVDDAGAIVGAGGELLVLVRPLQQQQYRGTTRDGTHCCSCCKDE